MLTTILAGVCLLPSALVLVGSFVVVGILSIPGLALLCYRKPDAVDKNSKKNTATHRRAIVTGGSSGIGLCVAKYCVQQQLFDELIIIARNQEKLDKALKQLKELQAKSDNPSLKITALSVDISKPEALQKAATQIFGNKKDDTNNDNNNEETPSISTSLFCIAGTTYPEYFEKLTPTQFELNVRTNQLGSIYTVHAFLPHMTQGTIVLCSSMAGQVGTFGFTAYSPTKYALRGFAEALQQEVCHRPIAVCVAYPPDTETPGFEQENLTKPPECHLISEDGGLHQPEEIAKILVDKAMQRYPPFGIYFNFDAWMLCNLTAGMGPVTTLLDALSQVAGMGLFRLISLFYLSEWTRMIRAYAEKKQTENTDTTKEATVTAKKNPTLEAKATDVSDASEKTVSKN